MKVCIAEKPSVAREIAEVLGAKNKMKGYIEGNGYQVTWTFGHLCTLKEPHEYTPEWKRWSLSSLPMIPPRFGIKLIDSPSYVEQFQVIEKLMQNAEMVINCGDAGQEGELIQRWVMQKAGVTCPVYRLWISSLTEEAIREGFQKLKEQESFNKLYEAGLSRAIGDWLLGMNATRLYTLKYGQNRQVLSIGRVQTPTLALIVNRQNEIANFTPEPYWELKTVYRNTTFSSTKGKFTDKTEGENFLTVVKEEDFEVTDTSEKKGKEYPPRLFDLTSLQVECNKKFAFSAEDTLKLIQSLYEKKVTTYPRVDTTFLSDDIYPKVPNTLKGMTDYAELTAPLLGKKLPKSKKVFDDTKVTDHHAIIPTGVRPNNLSENERKVYDLVARRFIAAFYPDCQISTTTVLGKVGKVEFKVTGKQILEPGWRVVFGAEQKDPDAEPSEEEGILPEFVKGERGPHEPILGEKWTQAPKPYTEATLLRAMETAGKLVDNDELRDALKENGIGRPSTRAAIIETLFKRNYVRKEKKNLIATPTGMELIGTIQEELLKSAELTGLWEKKLRQIEKGTYEARTFLEELKQLVYQIVSNVFSDTSARTITIQEAVEEKSAAEKGKKKTKSKPKEKPVKEETAPAETKPICPMCRKGSILRGKTAYGCSEYKNGCSFRLDYATYGEGLSDAQLIEILNKR
ncbi:MAG: DNA topoisomerase 3 [Parabacteroides sp.]|jgi:DNA topoisomerase-3|uniref:DNA topoisomerase 3 n=1 Tax=Macellibacteroides fermentans TaxID=879969 RepID=UPI002A0D6958|nr:DNA topoisomerase 3 [Parabacteroides sp.]MDD3508485.1 DNA topoisomerase 3 [Parabacteroides sp.]HRG12526.1 DNA topoisomerase 3 [Macellibacteroides fermentans]